MVVEVKVSVHRTSYEWSAKLEKEDGVRSGYYASATNTIYLWGKGAAEPLIEETVSHEFLHALVYAIEGAEACIGLDRVTYKNGYLPQPDGLGVRLDINSKSVRTVRRSRRRGRIQREVKKAVERLSTSFGPFDAFPRDRHLALESL